MKRFMIPTGLLFAVVIAVTAGSALLIRPVGKHAPPMVRLSLATSPWEFSSLVWVAEHQGYLAKNGVDLTIEEYPSGVADLKALLVGEVDMAVAAEFAFLNTIPVGSDCRIVTSIARIDDIELVANRQHGISQISDLRGKRIGLLLGSQAEFFLQRLLTVNYLSTRDVEMVDVKMADLEGAMLSGEIDAMICWQPYVYNIKQRLGAEALSWPAQGEQYYYWLLVTTNRVIAERQAVIERFLEALLEAEGFIESNPKRAQEIVQDRTKNKSNYLQTIWPRYHFTVALDQAFLVAVEGEARWKMRAELARGAQIPNYLDSIYFNCLEAVKPKRVRIIH